MAFILRKGDAEAVPVMWVLQQSPLQVSTSANEPFQGYQTVPALGWAVFCNAGVCIRPRGRELFSVTISWLVIFKTFLTSSHRNDELLMRERTWCDSIIPAAACCYRGDPWVKNVFIFSARAVFHMCMKLPHKYVSQMSWANTLRMAFCTSWWNRQVSGTKETW